MPKRHKHSVWLVIGTIGFAVIGGSAGGVWVAAGQERLSFSQAVERLTRPSSPETLSMLTPLTDRLEEHEVTTLQQELVAAETKRLTYTAPKAFQGVVVYEGKLKQAKDPIALTFDDGPAAGTTEQILDILQRYQAKATFFWVGQAVQAYPELARRVANAGHAIGNHTWHHRYYSMQPAEAASEIDTAAQLIYQATGIRTTLFRPPGGLLTNGMADYAASQHNTIVMWSITSADTDTTSGAQAYVNNVLNNAHAGAIVLMHDGGGDRSKTIQALPAILQGLTQQGYRFVTIPELLRMQDQGF